MADQPSVPSPRQQRFLDAIKSLELKFPVAEIAKKLEVGESTVSTYMNTREVSENFLRKFCEGYKIDFNKIWAPVENNLMEEDAVSYGPDKIIQAIKLYQETIRDLARQGVTLADGNKVMAEGYKVLSDANKVLADNNALLISKVNFGTPQHISATLEPFLRTIAAALAGKVWKDESAGLLELNKIVTESLKIGIKSDK